MCYVLSYGAESGGEAMMETGGRTMRLEKRIRALETRIVSDPVILHFADGTTREIHGWGDFLLDLLAGACGGDLSPRETAQLDLIRKSVDPQEPGAVIWSS
jgi:hypothetical protein